MGYIDLSVFYNPILKRIIAGIRRFRGEAETRERRPITRDLLIDGVAEVLIIVQIL